MSRTTSQNKPGTFVMYKLWPAVLYSSHIDAQPFMSKEKISPDYYYRIFAQYLNEMCQKSPPKPVVCVLGHPNKPTEEEWWYPVVAGETKPLTISNVSDYINATPEAFQGSSYQALSGVAEKMSTDEYRNVKENNITSGEAVPNRRSDTVQQEQNKSRSKNHKNDKVETKIQRKEKKAKKTRTQARKMMPSYPQCQPVPILLLQKVGFQFVDETLLSFSFSEDLPSTFSVGALAVILARYGIPNAHKLKNEEVKKICSWTRFANIPKATPSQLYHSENLSSKEIQDILRKFGFEIFSGAIYVPNCPHNERVYGIHYFHEQRLQSDFRSFLGWALDYASINTKMDCLDFVSELKANTPEHDLYIQLRLWAATQDEPLPNFSTRKLDVNFLKVLADPKIGASFANNVIDDDSPPSVIAADEDKKLSPRPSAKVSIQSYSMKKGHTPKRSRESMGALKSAKKRKSLKNKLEGIRKDYDKRKYALKIAERTKQKNQVECHNPSQPQPVLDSGNEVERLTCWKVKYD